MKYVKKFFGRFFKERRPTMENLAEEFQSWVGGVGQEMLEADARKHMALDRVQVREARPLGAVLDELENEMRKCDERLLDLFNPGLSSDEIRAALKTDQVNPDLISLYRWRNGLRDDQRVRLSLFGLYRFLPLAVGLRKKEMLSEFIVPDFMPVMDDECGNYLEISLTGDGKFQNILCEHIHDDASMFYPGPSAYFAAVAACLREGALVKNEEAGQEGEDFLIEDFDRVWDIHGRYRFSEDDA